MGAPFWIVLGRMFWLVIFGPEVWAGVGIDYFGGEVLVGLFGRVKF